MVIDKAANKDLNQVDVKKLNIGNGNGSGGGSCTRSNVICHTCGNKGPLQKDCKSKKIVSKVNSCNNSVVAWGFHWKDGHEECKYKKIKK